MDKYMCLVLPFYFCFEVGKAAVTWQHGCSWLNHINLWKFESLMSPLLNGFALIAVSFTQIPHAHKILTPHKHSQLYNN